jgi:DNA-directed RNA polymerase subunit K/omega
MTPVIHRRSTIPAGAFMSDEQLSGADPSVPAPPAEPIQSRFLFVDVAARRANQLKRGARPRLGHPEHDRVPHKLERVAMEEVRQRLVHYRLPELPSSPL